MLFFFLGLAQGNRKLSVFVALINIENKFTLYFRFRKTYQMTSGGKFCEV